MVTLWVIPRMGFDACNDSEVHRFFFCGFLNLGACEETSCRKEIWKKEVKLLRGGTSS